MKTQPLEGAPSTRIEENAASEHGSVVSYPTRCPQWGRAKFRGNCDGRLFLSLVQRYRPRRVADPMLGSGTTRDVIASWNLQRAEADRIDYWGSDLSEGFNLEEQDLPGAFDLVWVHPPYWNTIQFSNDRRDLSTEPDYSTFIRRLEQCLSACVRSLAPAGRLAVLVGDVRRRGLYYPIIRDVLNMEPRLGQLRSVIVKVQHNCTSDGRSYRLEDARIQHEYCIVFKRAQAGRMGTSRGRVEGRRA